MTSLDLEFHFLVSLNFICLDLYANSFKKVDLFYIINPECFQEHHITTFSHKRKQKEHRQQKKKKKPNVILLFPKKSVHNFSSNVEFRIFQCLRIMQ